MLFFAVLVLMGGKQGIKAFIGLVYTVVVIFFVLLPLIYKGFPAIPTTVAIIFVTSAVFFLLIGGICKKTVAAALGSLAGVIIAAILGTVSAKLGGVTTFQMEEAEALLLMKSTSAAKLSGLFISGILIAAMGAVMDIVIEALKLLLILHQPQAESLGQYEI